MIEPRLSVVSARTQPLNFVISLKVGSTFLRNLTYVLDHGEAFSEVERDYPKDLLRRELTREELANEVSFFVVRDPVARFFSLYFDKTLGDENARFPWLVETLKNNRTFFDGPEITVEQHRTNCESLLAYIGLRVRGKMQTPVNQHWNKQIKRVRSAIGFGMKPLMLENLESQLITIADGRIDGLEQAIAKVNSRNRSPRIAKVSDILTPDLKHRIETLYPEDTQLYDLIKTGWDILGHPPDIEL